MSLAARAVKNRTVTYFGAFLVFAAGIAAFFSLGQLEDPDFTVKTAVVITQYPGASPAEVEQEVTDRVELKVQEMQQLDFIESFSRAGMSIVFVNIKPAVNSTGIPQVWDELRRKIRDLEAQLPPGVQRPVVRDDFGDVFGHLLAVVGDGFSYAEMEHYAKELKRELGLVKGVARVDLWGAQRKVVHIDASQAQLTELGISASTIEGTLSQQNFVVDAGYVEVQNQRLRIDPTGAFGSAEDVAELPIRGSVADDVQAQAAITGAARSSELILIRDIAAVRSGYFTPPTTQMRFNGEPAIAIAISNVPGTNVVDMGYAVDRRLRELVAELPVGIEVHRVHWQSSVVDEAVKGFLVSFVEALLIVLVVLTIGMGWRLSMIIGLALTGTILGTFVIMAILGIDLQRMSLGALIIALGMMVDNAIVVAEGFVVRMEKGMERVAAAVEAASQPSLPLLGATVVAVMAFYPIAASNENAGEYCASLFSVVGISLLVSWLVSVTLTPVQCIDLLPSPKKAEPGSIRTESKFNRAFRSVLRKAIRARVLTLLAMIALLVASVVGFGQVKQLFFPDSSMPKFMVDYWAPEGTRIAQTSADLSVIENRLLSDERVENAATFIGAGPPRFYLPVSPEQQYASYGQIVVNVHDYRQIDGLIAEIEPWLKERFPDAQVPIKKFGVGPSETWKFEVRISGPSDADPTVLRRLASRVEQILAESPVAGLQRTDWRQRVQKVVPVYSQTRGRWAGVSRDDLAKTTKQAFDGRVVGVLRQDDELIPIILRNVEAERRNVGALDVLPIQPEGSTDSVPLAQVTDEVRVRWEDPLIWRRDRRRTITVQANPVMGATLPMLRGGVVDEIESLRMPPGYRLEWGGEYENSSRAQKSLLPGVIPAAVVIAFIVVALFNALRPPIVIALTIPFVLIGITGGLLGTGAAFGFVALLAAMSLVGMMIKNAIVLLDEVNLNLDRGMGRYEAVEEAAVSRLRPVVLAAGTTVLGVIPLLQDVFWVGLAVTIMAGLTVGTVLTMVLVPVLYATLFRIDASSVSRGESEPVAGG
jgi:multidrug efflux pump subunit AcrB